MWRRLSLPNWYASREQVKRSLEIKGVERDFTIDRIIESISRLIDKETRRYFIPRIETRLYRWPNSIYGQGQVLYLDQDLISITTLQSEAQNASPTTIASTDYFLEPNNTGPPFDRIEIDISSSASFNSGDTPQRSISVLGSWGFDNDTRSTGTVASGLASDATVTTFVCSDASLIEVGDTLLIQSEQVFVSNRDFAALAGSIQTNDAAIAADMADVTITVDGSHGILAGETIRLDSEEMYVERVATNDLTVIRAWNGTVLATHADDLAVHINRTLTIERGVNGTTGATHANATTISKYLVEREIGMYCVAESIASYMQERAGWGRQVGAGEGATEFSAKALGDLRKRVLSRYRRMRMAVV